ncbi:16S rRNA (cytidine(1402)-2'-O)-methyltransferase [Cochlodiniinecator piscidefendens]|uniref:16S rRNA (cytidine(1402)-2'-O)-methyltransferase n=1 Tax=Cochlodiniinecator piscidefendens TaxID=2715756 RepID=UPI00140CA712|nr:16S rRNA (cytidine(1402)-2'-O)-methyltransferase [Cochlodiniinecator piscidefendens]
MYQKINLAPGLYFVATPIGTARDITLRALDTLASADVIAAEDTRSLRRLLDIHGVPLGDRNVISYHDQNGPQARPKLLQALAEGKSVAYASEAGTPLVADPGYALSRAVIDAGHSVTSAPGPSAVIAALTIGGLATDKFMFAGFSPNAKNARAVFLEELKEVNATLVLYESPKRIKDTLKQAAETFGPAREAAVCREITKKFEEVARGSLADLAEQFEERSVKGEIVLLIDRERGEVDQADDMEGALREALQSMSMKDAVAAVSGALKIPRRKVYQAALDLEKE